MKSTRSSLETRTTFTFQLGIRNRKLVRASAGSWPWRSRRRRRRRSPLFPTCARLIRNSRGWRRDAAFEKTREGAVEKARISSLTERERERERRVSDEGTPHLTLQFSTTLEEKRTRRLPPRRGVRGPRQNPTRANHAREPKKESSHDTLKSPWVRSPSFFVRFRLLKMPTQGAEVRLYLRRRRSRSERRNRNCPSDCIVITSNGIDEITSRLNLKIPDFFFS